MLSFKSTCFDFDVLYHTRKTMFHHFLNTERRVENTTRGEVFLTSFEVFGNVVKQFLSV